jgi:hypothetical protein
LHIEYALAGARLARTTARPSNPHYPGGRARVIGPVADRSDLRHIPFARQSTTTCASPTAQQKARAFVDPALRDVASGKTELAKNTKGAGSREDAGSPADGRLQVARFGADGKFGDETVKALKKFQTDHCPKDAGRLDKQTLEQLGIASTKFPEYDKLFADGKLNTPIAVGYDEDRSDKGQAKDVIAGLTKRGYTQLDPDKAATDKPMAERFKAADSDEDVRYFAADALGDVRTAAVMQAIQTRLTAETSPVVRSALLAAKNKLDRAASR